MLVKEAPGLWKGKQNAPYCRVLVSDNASFRLMEFRASSSVIAIHEGHRGGDSITSATIRLPRSIHPRFRILHQPTYLKIYINLSHFCHSPNCFCSHFGYIVGTMKTGDTSYFSFVWSKFMFCLSLINGKYGKANLYKSKGLHISGYEDQRSVTQK